ncbi:hypothetical protein CEXT_791281 [Caerostris extrusa]|uniref:Uncharacterized protein n=1 Tax=Caerostris extrusa TaxID=172846 RepID=A0AAV4P2P1_CAEEX|nr:hypothetical protein CEXT_791281 [Caerostris extrusa]
MQRKKKNIRRAGVEPATYGFLFHTIYSPPLCQLSYRRILDVKNAIENFRFLRLQVPCGLVVRIPGFHPGGPGSIPGMGRKRAWRIFGKDRDRSMGNCTMVTGDDSKCCCADEFHIFASRDCFSLSSQKLTLGGEAG